MKIKAKLELPNKEELMKGCGLNEGGKAQRYIDNFVLEHSSPYEPGKHVHDSGKNATRIGSGEVIWDSPDANYLYEGKLMVDPISLKGAFYSPDYGFWSRPNTQKIIDPQNRDLTFHGGGKRGDHWFDRMIEEKYDDLVEGVQHIVNGDDI